MKATAGVRDTLSSHKHQIFYPIVSQWPVQSCLEESSERARMRLV